MKRRHFINIVPIILALGSIGTCVIFWGLVSGFERGYFYGVFHNPPPTPGIAVHGPNFFQQINIWYFTVFVGLCGYIFGKLFKPLVVSTVICVFSLSVALYPFWDMYFYKREVLEIDYPFSYTYWLRVSTYFDWLMICTVIALMLFQILLTLRSKADFQRIEIQGSD